MRVAVRIFVGTALTIACPILLTWSVIKVLVREIVRAFYYAYLEALIEFGSYLKLMKGLWNDDLSKR
jgi:hypothetical protein